MDYKVLGTIFLSIFILTYSQQNQSIKSNPGEATMKTSRIEIVKKFIEAYNSLDVEKMMTFLHPEIVFKNISNGEEDTHITGIDEFRELAKKSLMLFKEREQKIISYTEEGDTVNVEIAYHAILAIDLPNGLKAGDSLDLNGKSKYVFKDDLIILLVDES